MFRKVVDIIVTFSDRLNELLKKHDMKKKQFADVMYVVPQTVSRWCNNQIVPDRFTLERIADYFRVSVEYLLGECDAPNASDYDFTSYINMSNAFVTLLEYQGYKVSTETVPIGIHKSRENEFCNEYTLKPEITWILEKDAKIIRKTENEMEALKGETLTYLNYLLRKE